MWRTRNPAVVPAPDPEDLMDWQPTTPPPTTPEPPIYPQDQYVPGGWPNVLPTPRFARPVPLGAYFPSPKRVCLGLGRASATVAVVSANVALAVGTAAAVATVDATVVVGTAAAKYAARGAVHGAHVAVQTVGKTTISIVRKYNKEHPRARATIRNGVAYDRTRGYESPRFNRTRARAGLPSLDEENENKRRAEMEERERARAAAEAEYEAKFGRWENSFEKSSFVTVPFTIPNDPRNWTDQIKRSNEHLDEHTEAAAKGSTQQIQHVQQLPGSKPATAKPYSPPAKRLRKRRSNKPTYSLVNFKTPSRRAESTPRKAPTTVHSESYIDGPLGPILTPLPPPETPVTRTEEQEDAIAGPEFLWSGNTESPAEANDHVYVPHTPSRDTRPRPPVHSPGTWARVQQMFFTPPRPEQPTQPKQEEQQLNAEDTEVTTAEQDEQQLNAEGTEVTTTEQQEKELNYGSTEAAIIPETVSTPIRETEQPSRPDTPSTSYSDISSTCAITPIPYELKHISPAGDAVGPSSPSPQAAAESAPPSRTLSSVVGKIPGGWDEKTTVGGQQDDESDQPSSGPVARRTRSMQVRLKKEEEVIRTPQKEAKTEPIKKPAAKIEKTAAEPAPQTPRTAKTPKHGTSKTKIANTVQERRETLRRAAEKWKITGLSEAWIEKVEDAVTYGDKRSGLKAGDFARVAPFRTQGASRDNWLNDETINEYLTIVAAHGQNTPDANGKKATHKTHHAFNSFFLETFNKKGVGALARWGKRGKIEGKKLLNTKQVYIPINASAHWTLAVVSGVNRTITHYDSLGGKGTKKMEQILEWVAMELGGDFVRSEWRLLEGVSGRQTNSDDCGVFAVTNARSLMLDESPEKSFGPDKVRFQRERIVAEIVNGALLPRGA